MIWYLPGGGLAIIAGFFFAFYYPVYGDIQKMLGEARTDEDWWKESGF